MHFFFYLYTNSEFSLKELSQIQPVPTDMNLADLYFRENIDYVHLKYDIDFEKPLSKTILNKIT